ncbi:hypothetical protein [uncultured Helicobacter sp.]|uniref:hypothetical protein n=1 Tax=uncultured Helicobacter sp. TaxID=175537 RepID=UPI00374ED664
MIGQGDGYKYRGKGLIHLTFKEHYERASIYAKKQGWIDTDNYFVNNPDSITNNGKYALLSAVYYWKKNALYSYADNDNGNIENIIIEQNKTIKVNSALKSITRLVNGKRLMHIKDRQDHFVKIKQRRIFRDFT